MADVSLTEEGWRDLVTGKRRGLYAAAMRRFFWLGSRLYAVGVCWRNRRFAKGHGVERAGVPVISVGNLTMGGTGKTPCVEYIARLLRTRELAVAILSRGYGAEAGRNDEAMVLEENLPDVPHLQGRDRVALSAMAVHELESEVLVLDDGFQHRRLARDLDIVLIDATEPWGYGDLFPRGALREPFNALGRANLIVITRSDCVSEVVLKAIGDRIVNVAPSVPVVRAVHCPIELANGLASESVDALRGRKIAAFCGIGNPDAFVHTLKAIGADVQDFLPFPDHCAYTKNHVMHFREWAGRMPEDRWIVTTQKDWVKLRVAEFSGRRLLALRIGMKFVEGGELFDSTVLRVVQQTEPAQP